MKISFLRRIVAVFLSVLTVVSVAGALGINAAAAEKLPAPENIEAVSFEGKIVLSWNSDSDADAYRVYIYDEKTDAFRKYKDVEGRKCAVSNVKNGKKYVFRVAALVKKGGKYSAGTRSKKITATGRKSKLPAPKEIKTEVGETRVTFSFKPVKGAYLYKAYMCYDDDPDGYECAVSISGKPFLAATNLKPGKSYTFRVAAVVYDENSKECIQTKSEPMTVKTKKAAKPAEFTAPAFGTSEQEAVKISGIVDTVSTDSDSLSFSDLKMSVCNGKALLNGSEVTVMLMFSAKDGKKELFGYTLYSSEYGAKASFDKEIKKYRNDKSYKTDPESDDTRYIFTKGNVEVDITYNFAGYGMTVKDHSYVAYQG